jgi:hypothetical protein
VACYRPANRPERVETERFRPFTYEEPVSRDKGPLDIVWLRDESAVLGPAHSVNQIVQTYRSWHHSEQILDYCLTAGALRWGISIAHACGQSKGYEHRKQLRGAHHGLEGSLTVRRRCASINLTRVQ